MTYDELYHYCKAKYPIVKRSYIGSTVNGGEWTGFYIDWSNESFLSIQSSPNHMCSVGDVLIGEKVVTVTDETVLRWRELTVDCEIYGRIQDKWTFDYEPFGYVEIEELTKFIKNIDDIIKGTEDTLYLYGEKIPLFTYDETRMINAL